MLGNGRLADLAVFVADFIARIWLADRRWSYIGQHPVDLLVIALPALRPLRILRVFTAGQIILTRGRKIAIGRALASAAGAAAVLTFIGALAVLDAERGQRAPTSRTSARQSGGPGPPSPPSATATTPSRQSGEQSPSRS